MSRHNKVNRDRYTIAGRLTADDLARERRKQGVGNPAQDSAVSKRHPKTQPAAPTHAGQARKTNRRSPRKQHSAG
jgi:hypothetical protein